MARFDLAIPIVLRHEGGFVDSPNDPGGATNYGVSMRWLQSRSLLAQLEEEEGVTDPVTAIKKLTQDEAKAFYQQFWWDAYNYSAILAQAVANKVFDMAVNLGAPRAHRMVQQVIGVTPDGVLGPKSLSELNAEPSLKVIMNLQNTQAQFYRNLVAKNSRLQPFLSGWLNRAYDRN